ncbi:MAG: DUF1727 domain-containing protein [Brockia lithotrophica]|nr:DUF1727 domain-containing protein [Brockia lithotrophica]MBT9252330.1 DUF1727 domain-containing protein [Brockia lithotrophica]
MEHSLKAKSSGWMGKFLCGVAFRAARLVRLLLRLRPEGGSSLPGYVFLKLCPRGLSHWADQVTHVLFLTGTNGKTTTTALVASALRESGISVVTNDKGANMPSGLATAFVNAADPSGRLPRGAYAVFEVDEGSLPALVRELAPDVVVLLNLYPDQLDRYGSPRELSERLRKTLAELDRSFEGRFTVVANADQPLTVYAAQGARSPSYFGLEAGEERDEGEAPSEACPYCGAPLVYTVRLPEALGPHLGRYRCPVCGFRRPDADVREGRILPPDSFTRGFLLEVSGRTFAVPLLGTYNAYTVLAAWSAASALGVSPDAFARALARFRLPRGRMEVLRASGVRATLNLAKNAAGMRVTLSEFLRREGPKRFLLAVNNAPADGEDASWIADAGLSALVRSDVEAVVVTGTRREDLARVLREEGFAAERLFVEAEPRTAVARLLGSPYPLAEVFHADTGLFLIANYTALPPVREALVASGFTPGEEGEPQRDEVPPRGRDQTIA